MHPKLKFPNNLDEFSLIVLLLWKKFIGIEMWIWTKILNNLDDCNGQRQSATSTSLPHHLLSFTYPSQYNHQLTF